MNQPLSTDARIELMMICSYGAVREHFSHLTVAEIVNPPRQFSDAYVALHMATAIMCEEFGVSRRQAARTQVRFKSAVYRSIEQVEERRQEPVFDQAYRRIAARALALYETEAQRAAA